MTKPLFQTLFDLSDGVDITIGIKRIDGNLSVAVLAIPRINDPSKSTIPPISLTGTPEEFDLHFVEEITRPLQKVTSWGVDMKKFEAELEVNNARSKRAKEDQDKADKVKKSYDALILKANQKMAQKNHRQALADVNEAIKILPENPIGIRLKKDLVEILMGPADLFSAATTEPLSIAENSFSPELEVESEEQGEYGNEETSEEDEFAYQQAEDEETED